MPLSRARLLKNPEQVKHLVMSIVLPVLLSRDTLELPPDPQNGHAPREISDAASQASKKVETAVEKKTNKISIREKRRGQKQNLEVYNSFSYVISLTGKPDVNRLKCLTSVSKSYSVSDVNEASLILICLSMCILSGQLANA